MLHSIASTWGMQYLFVLLLLVALAQQVPGLPPVPGITRPEDAPPTPQYLFNLLHVVIVLMLVAYYTTTEPAANTNFHHAITDGQLSHATVAAVLMGLYPALNLLQYVKHRTPHFLPVTAVAVVYAVLGFSLAKHGCTGNACQAGTAATSATGADVPLIKPLRKICEAFGFGKIKSTFHAYAAIGLWLVVVIWRSNFAVKSHDIHPEEKWLRLVEGALLVIVIFSLSNKRLLRVGTWGLIALLLYALANHISDWFYLDAVLALVTFTALRHTTLNKGDGNPVLSQILCL